MTMAACINVVESVVLFMNLQYEHVSKASKQLKPSLAVTIDTLQPDTHPESVPHEKCYFVVLASGLGAYFLDGETFLKNLCVHSTSLTSLLQQQSGVPLISTDNDPVMEILTRRMGDPGNVTSYRVEGFVSSTGRGLVEPVVRETVVQRPSDLHPAALLVKFKVLLPVEDIHSQAMKQLHLLHLINPEISLSFCIKGRSGETKPSIQITFDSTLYKSIPKTPYKLITSVDHYMNFSSISPQSLKLRLFKGDTHIISDCVSLRDGRLVSLKLYSMVAVLPTLRLRQGRKIPANRLCKRLHLFVFGLHSLPLVHAGCHPGFPLSALADWDSYGLAVKNSHTSDGTSQRDHPVAVPSYACELGNTRPDSSLEMPSSQQHTRPLTTASKHTLYLFIFLEDPSAGQRHRVGDNSQWRHNMELLHKLRGEFQDLVVAQSKKFHQVTHSALNKVICNYGSHAKTKSVMTTALPLLADAVASIVKHSTNSEFRKTALQIMMVEDVDCISSKVEQKLWRIAEDKIKVPHPTNINSRNPDEPTTPELSLATSEPRPETTQPESKPTDPVLLRHGTSPDTGKDQEGRLTWQLKQTDDEDDPGNQESGTQIRLQSTESQSLFNARITTRTKTEEEDNCTENELSLKDSEDVTGDEHCFESLCNFNEGTNMGTYTQEGSWVMSEDHEPMEVRSIPEDASQMSQPLIGTAFNCMSHTGEFSHNEDGGDFSDLDSFIDEETMSISSFDELEDCTEGSSFLEGMDYDFVTSEHENSLRKICSESVTEQCSTTSATGFDELELFRDDNCESDSQATVEGPNSNDDTSEEAGKQVAPEEMEDCVATGRSVSQQHIPTQEEQAKEDRRSIEHTHTTQTGNQVDYCINLKTPLREILAVGITEEIDSETQLDNNSCVSDDDWNDVASCSTPVRQTEARELTSGLKQTVKSPLKMSTTQELTDSRDDSEVDFDLLAEHELAESVMEDMSKIHSDCGDSGSYVSAVFSPSPLHAAIRDNTLSCDVNEKDFIWD